MRNRHGTPQDFAALLQLRDLIIQGSSHCDASLRLRSDCHDLLVAELVDLDRGKDLVKTTKQVTLDELRDYIGKKSPSINFVDCNQTIQNFLASISLDVNLSLLQSSVLELLKCQCNIRCACYSSALLNR